MAASLDCRHEEPAERPTAMGQGGCRNPDNGVNGLRICHALLQQSEAILLVGHNGVQSLNKLSRPTWLLNEKRSRKGTLQLLGRIPRQHNERQAACCQCRCKRACAYTGQIGIDDGRIAGTAFNQRKCLFEFARYAGDPETGIDE